MSGWMLATALALAQYASGNAQDVHPPLHGPVLDLAGSAAEERGLQAMIDAVRGCTDCDANLAAERLAEGRQREFERVGSGVEDVDGQRRAASADEFS